MQTNLLQSNQILETECLAPLRIALHWRDAGVNSIMVIEVTASQKNDDLEERWE